MSEPSKTTTVDQSGESFDLGDGTSLDIANRLDAKLYGAEDGDAVSSGAAATGNVNLALLNASVADEASLNSDELITDLDSASFSSDFLGDDNSGGSDAPAGRAGDDTLASQTQFSGPTGGGSSSIPQTESFSTTGSKDSDDDLRNDGAEGLEARDPASDDSGTGNPPSGGGSTSQDNPPNDGGGSGSDDPPNGDGGSGNPPDDGATDVIDDVVDGTTDVVDDVVDTVGDVVDDVTDVVDDTVGAVTDTVDDVVDGTTDVVDDVVDAVSDTVGNVGEVVDDVVDNLTDTVDDVVGGISEPLGDVVGGVTEVVDDVVDGVTDTVSSVVETSDDLLGDVTETVDGIVDGATDAVTELAGQTTELVDDVVNTVGDTVGNLTGSVDGVVDDVTNLIDDVLGGGADDPSGGSDDTDLVANLGGEDGLDVNLDPVESLLGDIDLNLNSEIEILDGASGAGLTDSLTGLTDGLLGGGEDDPSQGSDDTDLVVDLNPSEDGSLLDVNLDPVESVLGDIDVSIDGETALLDDVSGGELTDTVSGLTDGILSNGLLGGGEDDSSQGSDDTDLVVDLNPSEDGSLLDVNLDPIESVLGDIDVSIDGETALLDDVNGGGLTDGILGEGLLGGGEDDSSQGSGDTDLVADLNPSEDGSLLDVNLDPIESLIGEIDVSTEGETELLDDASGGELIGAVEELAGGVLGSDGEEGIEDVEALLDLDLLDQSSGTDGLSDGAVSALEVEVPDLTGSVSEGLSGLIDDSGIDGLGGLFG